MEEKRFYEACQKIINEERKLQGIGTLGEKTLHAVLKNYCEPKEQYHEIRQEGYVADIATEEGIIEVQTRNFNKLRKKLDVFLKNKPVTIVYPIPYIKWLCWIDCETGVISKKRKSPKQGSYYDCFSELYKIKSYLTDPNLRIRILLINMEESRLLNGWSEDKKKGSHRYDRLPVELVDELEIKELKDYEKLIPESLEEVFSTKEYRKATKLSEKNARTGVHILAYLGIIKKVGKKGNLILYTRNY